MRARRGGCSPARSARMMPRWRRTMGVRLPSNPFALPVGEQHRQGGFPEIAPAPHPYCVADPAAFENSAIRVGLFSQLTNARPPKEFPHERQPVSINQGHVELTMQGTVAVTDYDWYRFLSGRNLPEVNFWTPSDRRAVNAPPSSPFFFKLKVPRNAVCGFGYFVRWVSLPDWLAWDWFREGNGCGSLEEMSERIGVIRRRIRYDEAGSLNNIG